jgi:PPP family 3-phenylpropionic acid transporter
MRRMPPTVPNFVAVYGLLYAAFGVQSPFLPALLREQGLHPEEIGIVLGASTAIRVFAGPAIGHAADRLHRHTSILCGCAIVAAIAGLGYLMIHGLGTLLLVGLLHAAMFAPIVPLSDALAPQRHTRASLMADGVSIMDGCARLARQPSSLARRRAVGLPEVPACQA